LKELEAKKYLKNLYSFNFDVLGLEPVGSYSKTLRELSSFVEKKKNKFKLILLPRGHLKSTVITVGSTLRAIAEDKSSRTLICSATYTMATTFLNQIKKTLSYNEKFKKYYGDLSKNASRWSENQIDVKEPGGSYATKEPTVTVMGVDGNLVSQHYDRIILDDVVGRSNTGTKDQIDKVKLAFKDMLDLLEPGGELIVIGTRWHYDDLYGAILGDNDNPDENLGNNFLTFVRQAVEGGDLEKGKILWPAKFTRDKLNDLYIAKGPYEFNCQYQNTPIDDESATFKKSWFKYYNTDMLKGRNLRTVLAVDPAISLSKEADYTAMVVLSKDQFGYEYIRDIVREKLTPKQLVDNIFKLYEKWHPSQIGIEMVAFQKALQYFIHDEMQKRKIRLPIEELRPDRGDSKEIRIRRLQPKYASGSVWHDRLLPHTLHLEDELLRFPKAPHDDIIDALAYADGMSIRPSKRTFNEDAKKNTYLY